MKYDSIQPNTLFKFSNNVFIIIFWRREKNCERGKCFACWVASAIKETLRVWQTVLLYYFYVWRYKKNNLIALSIIIFKIKIYLLVYSIVTIDGNKLNNIYIYIFFLRWLTPVGLNYIKLYLIFSKIKLD